MWGLPLSAWLFVGGVGATWAPCVPLRMGWRGGGCLSPAALAGAWAGDCRLLL